MLMRGPALSNKTCWTHRKDNGGRSCMRTLTTAPFQPSTSPKARKARGDTERREQSTYQRRDAQGGTVDRADRFVCDHTAVCVRRYIAHRCTGRLRLYDRPVIAETTFMQRAWRIPRESTTTSDRRCSPMTRCSRGYCLQEDGGPSRTHSNACGADGTSTACAVATRHRCLDIRGLPQTPRNARREVLQPSLRDM